MELLQLKYFCHAAKTESFTRTAEAFLVPQSNVSQCIRRLEEELGIPLFIRSANRIKLSPQGQVYYQSISEAMSLIESSTDALCNTSSKSIYLGIHLCRRFVSRAISNFMKQYPDIEIVAEKFSPGTNPDNFDMIISDGSIVSKKFSSERILHDRIVLISPRGLLPKEPKLPASLLCRQSFITPAKNSLMYRDTLKICNHLGFKPRITLQCEHSHLIAQMVEQGSGVSLLPYNIWAQIIEEMDVDINDVGEFYRDTYVYKKKSQIRSPYMKYFYTFLLEEFRRVQAEDSLSHIR